VKIKVVQRVTVIFWDMTPLVLVEMYRHCSVTYCLHINGTVQVITTLCRIWDSLSPLLVRDSSVGISTRYGLEGPGIESRFGARFCARVQTGPGAHLSSYTLGTGSFPGVNRPGRCVDHPPHLAPRLKNE
jgi:hypothetical protein